MKSNILDIIDINKLASNLGFSYLDYGYGYWEDGSGKKWECRNMKKEHLRNSINFVDRGIGEIKDGDVAKDIKKLLSSEELDEVDIKKIENKLIELLNSKKKELKDVYSI